MKLLSTLPALAGLALLPNAAFADDTTFLPSAASSTFPSCGLSCTTLTSAQSGCVPPAAPVTDYTTYVSCFCQSALLTSLYSTPDGVCTDVCTVETDRQLLQTWYTSFCASGGATTATATTATTAATATSTSSSSGSTTGDSSDSGASWDESNSAQHGWFANHWRWVVMLIVLALGFTAIGVAARWYRSRRQRKLDEKNLGLPTSNAGGSHPSIGGNGNDMWGPHQSQAHTRVWDFATDGESQRNLASEKAPMPNSYSGSTLSKKGSVITKTREKP